MNRLIMSLVMMFAIFGMVVSVSALQQFKYKNNTKITKGYIHEDVGMRPKGYIHNDSTKIIVATSPKEFIHDKGQTNGYIHNNTSQKLIL